MEKNNQENNHKISISLDDIYNTKNFKNNELNPKNLFKIDLDNVTKINMVQYRSNINGYLYYLDNNNNLKYIILKVYYDINLIKSNFYFTEIIVKNIMYCEEQNELFEDKILYFDDFRESSEDYNLKTKAYSFISKNFYELSNLIINQIEIMFYNITGISKDNKYKTIWLENEIENNFTDNLNEYLNINEIDNEETKKEKIIYKDILKRNYNSIKFFNNPTQSVWNKNN